MQSTSTFPFFFFSSFFPSTSPLYLSSSVALALKEDDSPPPFPLFPAAFSFRSQVPPFSPPPPLVFILAFFQQIIKIPILSFFFHDIRCDMSFSFLLFPPSLPFFLWVFFLTIPGKKGVVPSEKQDRLKRLPSLPPSS